MIMENIPTTEEFYQHAIDDKNIGDDITDLLNAYAKLHVEAALKAASNNSKVSHPYVYEHTDFSYKVDKNSILNAYPLENIK